MLIWGLRGPKSGLRVRILGLDGQGGGTEGQTDGHLEITPCVLLDIGPLGPLPKKEVEVVTKRKNARESHNSK